MRAPVVGIWGSLTFIRERRSGQRRKLRKFSDSSLTNDRSLVDALMAVRPIFRSGPEILSLPGSVQAEAKTAPALAGRAGSARLRRGAAQNVAAGLCTPTGVQFGHAMDGLIRLPDKVAAALLQALESINAVRDYRLVLQRPERDRPGQSIVKWSGR